MCKYTWQHHESGSKESDGAIHKCSCEQWASHAMYELTIERNGFTPPQNPGVLCGYKFKVIQFVCGFFNRKTGLSNWFIAK